MNRHTPSYPVPALYTHSTERKYIAQACPTCAGPLPPATFGRPPVYCSPACRAEMARLRRDLGKLDAEAERARSLAGHGFWPGADFWHKEAERLESTAADVRSRVREAMR